MRPSFLYVPIVVLCSLFAGVFTGASAQNGREMVREGNSAASGQTRVALVIGNAAYVKTKPLTNPANDAADMAAALRKLGFDVISGTDLDKRRMEALIREFGAKLAAGGTGLFYYAGHGLQVNGENYLVPVDADIPEENEVAYAGVPLGLVLAKMSSARNDLNIVILDACRNNPFARSWRGYRDTGSNDGLAKISPPTGVLILYATEPGRVASDGAGRNGLFTEALLKQLPRPNIEYDQMVKALSAEVWQRSGQKQLPWKEGNSIKDFYFVASSNGTTATVPAPVQQPQSAPQTEYDRKVADINSKNQETSYKNELINKAFNAGIAAFNAKDFDLAITKFDEAAALDPTWPMSAPFIFHNKATTLRTRGVARYNDAVKLSGTGRDQAMFKARQDISLAFEALQKAIEVIKGATSPDLDQAKLRLERFSCLKDVVEIYRLMLLSQTPFPEGFDPKPYFDEYLSGETDDAAREKAKKVIEDVRGATNTTGGPPPGGGGETQQPPGPLARGVLNGKAINLVQPPYPSSARAIRASGVVTVKVVIDETGNVISAQAISGHVLLQKAAEKAAMESKFSPTLLSGKPVKVSGVINYNFELPNAKD